MNISRIKNPAATSTKTASAETPTKSALERAMAAVVQDEPAKPAQEKVSADAQTASAHAASLAKIAEEVAASNFDRQIAQVDKLGSVMAQAFVRELSNLEQGAQKIAAEYTASANLTPDELAMIHDLRTQPEVFFQKVAAMRGPTQLTEKEAADLYEKTAQDTVRQIHKLAMEHHVAGYQAADALISGAT
jgi:ribosome maturation protein Sdo1